MAKPHDRANARLQRRKAGFTRSKTGESRLPGSMNPHKASPVGRGRRSRSQVQAASRQASR